MIGRTRIGWVGLLLAAISLSLVMVPERAAAQDEPVAHKELRAVIERALTEQGVLKDNNVQVTVAPGTVTLSGTVITIADKIMAEKETHKIAGGFMVIDNISVNAPAQPDQKIAAEVSAAIRRHTFYTVFDWVTIQVAGGVVTLQGWVHQPWRKAEFVAQAYKIVGVKQVNDELVALPLSYYDDNTRSRAATLIYDDPTFDDHVYDADPPIHIIVDNGKVILKGIVDNQAEKATAEDIVKFNTDVTNIDNQLVIQKP